MAARKTNRHSDLKNMLEARRRALLVGVRDSIRESSEKTSMPRQGDVLDTGDEGEAMLQDALRFAVIGMKSEIAARIEEALARLADGRYGACGDCGQDIADARLRAMPFALRCRRCEQSHEDAERTRGTGPRLMGRLRIERPATAVLLEE
jgi:DnaK suppressor protein